MDPPITGDKTLHAIFTIVDVNKLLECHSRSKPQRSSFTLIHNIFVNRHPWPTDNRLYNMNHFHFSDQGMTTSWTAMVKDNRENRTSGVMFVLVSLVIIVSRSHC